MYFWIALQAVIPFTWRRPNRWSLSMASNVMPFLRAKKTKRISLAES
jgi:hypothetical protein